MSKQAMKLALEALDHNLLFTSLMPGYDGRVIEKAYKAINKVLAEQQPDWEAVAADQAMTIALLRAEQPAQQEYERGFIDGMQEQMKRSVDRAVNAMAQRTWVGLTDEEITDIWAEASPYYHEDDFARAIEAKLKQRNT